MFSKKPEPEPSYPSLAPRVAQPAPASEGARSVNNTSTFSVIGNDVVIRGNIEATADLHIDGAVEGDIVCAALVQGESSRIEGAITAENARLSGAVKGTITVRELVVLKNARIDGDVHYDTLTIEQGANVSGRFAPDAAASRAKAHPAQAQPQQAVRTKPAEVRSGSEGEGEPRLTLAN
ncbi:MAG: polymer-forming cytoskeletal protein [Croceibacterium sp.]